VVIITPLIISSGDIWFSSQVRSVIEQLAGKKIETRISEIGGEEIAQGK
jgi:hypothetical protein